MKISIIDFGNIAKAMTQNLLQNKSIQLRVAATELGIQKDVATAFTLQTVHGAVDLAMTSNTCLDVLRASVTSPAGTTVAALSVFMEHGFGELIQNAMQTASARAKQLGSLF